MAHTRHSLQVCQLQPSLFTIFIPIIFFLLFASAHAGQEGIEVLTWNCTEEASQIVVHGEIRNQSKTPVTPNAIAVFRSIKGEMIAHAKGSPVFSPLAGGQTSPIELRSLGRRDIASCELSILDASTGSKYFYSSQELPHELPDGLGDSVKGRFIFNGKGVCNGCHGYLGRIEQLPDGSAANVAKLNPKPSNFRSPQSLKLATDKQRFRAIKYGIPGTGMVPMRHISDEEIIDTLAYMRTLRQESTGGQQ